MAKQYRPIDDDSKEESSPDSWAEQRAEAEEIGENIAERQDGEPINDLFD